MHIYDLASCQQTNAIVVSNCKSSSLRASAQNHVTPDSRTTGSGQAPMDIGAFHRRKRTMKRSRNDEQEHRWEVRRKSKGQLDVRRQGKKHELTEVQSLREERTPRKILLSNSGSCRCERRPHECLLLEAYPLHFPVRAMDDTPLQSVRRPVPGGERCRIVSLGLHRVLRLPADYADVAVPSSSGHHYESRALSRGAAGPGQTDAWHGPLLGLSHRQLLRNCSPHRCECIYDQDGPPSSRAARLHFVERPRHHPCLSRHQSYHYRLRGHREDSGPIVATTSSLGR